MAVLRPAAMRKETSLPAVRPAEGALREHAGPLKQRHEVLPPVQHRFGAGPLARDVATTVAVYRHRLLQHLPRA